MKNSICLLSIVSCLASIAAEVVPQSGDVVMIGDAAYVIVDKADWERMKLAVDDLRGKWAMMHSNETGRVALHGRAGHRTITADAIIVEYADGYRHVESTRQNAVKREVTNRPKPLVRPRPIMPNEAAIAARKAALATTNEVTVTIGE